MIQLDVVEIAPMEDRMVFLDPGTMSRELGTAGRVALYGVQFDFGSDVVKPDSAPQLEAIAVLLQGAPEMKLMVVGHTDASGSSDYNLELSGRRAAAVVAALTSSYGIAADRLSNRRRHGGARGEQPHGRGSGAEPAGRARRVVRSQRADWRGARRLKPFVNSTPLLGG
jgi:hypothetical protein